jgi:hypothetical protein
LNPTPKTQKTPELLSFTKIPETNPHRPVDIEIVKADASGICKSYIILPSTIWGEGKGDLYQKGIANSFSDQIPTLIRASLDRGKAGNFDKGKFEYMSHSSPAHLLTIKAPTSGLM